MIAMFFRGVWVALVVSGLWTAWTQGSEVRWRWADLSALSLGFMVAVAAVVVPWLGVWSIGVLIGVGTLVALSYWSTVMETRAMRETGEIPS